MDNQKEFETLFKQIDHYEILDKSECHNMCRDYEDGYKYWKCSYDIDHVSDYICDEIIKLKGDCVEEEWIDDLNDWIYFGSGKDLIYETYDDLTDEYAKDYAIGEREYEDMQKMMKASYYW